MKPLSFMTFQQGSTEWQNAKLGVPSASNISRALAKKGTETRNTYLMELVGQIATKQFDEINAKALEHGKLNEEAARAAYQFESGNKIEEVGFIYSESKRFGISPDGIIKDQKKGLELKCPATAKVHADFLCNDKMKSDYEYQVQYSLWVTGFDSWDFASFHPFFKSQMIKIKTIEPDQKLFERFDNELPVFINDLDEALKKIGLTYGEQWK
jgi:exodeoxyribonuclease (lambda-induced)